MKKIGTAKLLVDRVYENPYSPDYPVIVNPGVYDIIKLDCSIYLSLTGFALRPIGFEPMPSEFRGMLMFNPRDSAASDIAVDVIPVLWTEEEFEEFIKSDICSSGSNQRWIISLNQKEN